MNPDRYNEPAMRCPVSARMVQRQLWLFLALAAAANGLDTAEMLAAHNTVRAKVGVPPLAWSDRLAALAQTWAETLIVRNEFVHRPKSPYGENLFEISGAQVSPRQVVDEWAAEARNYDYRSNRCKAVCGHYTQIIWRETKKIGCGVARKDQTEIWVCNYDPPGNIVGRPPY